MTKKDFKKHFEPPKVIILLFFLLFLLVFFASFFIGRYPIKPSELILVLFSRIFNI